MTAATEEDFTHVRAGLFGARGGALTEGTRSRQALVPRRCPEVATVHASGQARVLGNRAVCKRSAMHGQK